MSDENDSWFKPFGFDPQKFVADAVKTVENTATAVVQEAKAVVQQAGNAVSSAVKTVTSAVAPRGPATAAAPKAGQVSGDAGGSSVSSLGGSVGQGGQNNPDDVKAVQRALGLNADGKCGPLTINAIVNFQKTMGQAKPDGRVDAGGATSRALAGGAQGTSAAAPAPAPAPADDDSESFFDRAVKGAKDLGGKIVKEAGEELDAATAFGGEIIEGAKKVLGDPNIARNQVRPPDAGAGTDAGTPDGGPSDAGTAPDPVFVDVDDPFKVRADNPQEFSTKGNEYLALGAAGHMSTDTLSVANLEADAKGRVVKSNLRVVTRTKRPVWAGGRTRGDESAVIQQAQDLIQQHEERHRQIMKNGMINAVNEMRGLPKAQADGILVKAINAVNALQDQLDAREGQLDIIQNKEGIFTGARLVPVRKAPSTPAKK